MGGSNSTSSSDKQEYVWIKSFGSTRARKNDEEWKDRVDRAKETIANIEAQKEAERREREAKELAERMKRSPDPLVKLGVVIIQLYLGHILLQSLVV